MKFATATVVVLASALSALVHAESAVNEAPVQLLAMNHVTARIAPMSTAKAPAIEEIVVSAKAERFGLSSATDRSAVANAGVSELALNEAAATLGQQLEQVLAHDLAK